MWTPPARRPPLPTANPVPQPSSRPVPPGAVTLSPADSHSASLLSRHLLSGTPPLPVLSSCAVAPATPAPASPAPLPLRGPSPQTPPCPKSADLIHSPPGTASATAPPTNLRKTGATLHPQDPDAFPARLLPPHNVDMRLRASPSVPPNHDSTYSLSCHGATPRPNSTPWPHHR